MRGRGWKKQEGDDEETKQKGREEIRSLCRCTLNVHFLFSLICLNYSVAHTRANEATLSLRELCLSMHMGVCVCVRACASAAVQCEVCTQSPAACDCQSYDSSPELVTEQHCNQSLPHSLACSTTPTSSLSSSCSFLSPF